MRLVLAQHCRQHRMARSAAEAAASAACTRSSSAVKAGRVQRVRPPAGTAASCPLTVEVAAQARDQGGELLDRGQVDAAVAWHEALAQLAPAPSTSSWSGPWASWSPTAAEVRTAWTSSPTSGSRAARAHSGRRCVRGRRTGPPAAGPGTGARRPRRPAAARLHPVGVHPGVHQVTAGGDHRPGGVRQRSEHDDGCDQPPRAPGRAGARQPPPELTPRCRSAGYLT